MKKINSFTYLLMAILLLIGTVLLAFIDSFTYAETTGFSNVLDDLKTDSNFHISDYPLNTKDYSVKVIQIAESTNAELFIYAYHPCGNTKQLIATSINISTAEKSDGSYKNYSLTLLNSSGVFYKYKVNDFTVSSAPTRKYEISSILRKWVSGVDSSVEGNTISEKAYPVGQLWTAETVDGKVTYTVKDVEYVDITKMYVNFRRYENGFAWSGIEHCDAHFMVFSCKNNIDRLLSADVDFYTQSYTQTAGQEVKPDGKKEPHSVTVTAGDKGASDKKEWSRLASTQEFVDELGITGDERANFLKYEWIINFYETEYYGGLGGRDIIISLFVPGGFIWSAFNAFGSSGTIVSDVMLMRLEFEYEGQIYNLGVVSNRVTGPLDPSNTNDFKGGCGSITNLKSMFAALGLILLVFVLLATGLFPLIINSLVWLISAPFKALAKLFKKKKE